MEGKKLCEVHHLQGRHRQNKEKVPESLKIQRKTCKKTEKQVKKTLKNVSREAGNVGASEALDGALKKMKLKRGDLHLELIRVFLKRQVEKKKERELMKNNDREERELPNGLMEILPGQNLDTVNGFCNVKLGFDPNSIPTRRFRSKNIEPVPIGTMQVLPFARDVAKLKKKYRKKCHWCRKTSYCSLIQCSSCKKEWFCKDCISERASTSEEEVKIKCPVCLRTCGCRSCLRSQSEDNKHNIRRIQNLQYLIRMLLPVLKQLNLEQRNEMELEARLTGMALSELQIHRAESSCNKQYLCNNCQTSIVDIHRSCKNCLYSLCLHCSENSHGSLKAFLSKCRNKSKPLKSGGKVLKTKRMKKTVLQDFGNNSLLLKWEACDDDGRLTCPPVTFGGCGDGSLSLKRVFPSEWTEEVESRAEEIVQNCDFPEKMEDLCWCGGTDNDKGIKASSRKKSEDNFLYYPCADDSCGEKLEHFQKHWGKGHPVIVRRVTKRARDLSWDPITMFCAYLEKTSTRSRNSCSASKATNCLDWCELEICRKQIFMGSLEGQSHANMRDETMKLKLWISSSIFQEQFPNHHAEILGGLPLQEYTNPISGLYNLASILPRDTDKPDFGPCVHISFGSPEDFLRADFVTNLFCNPHDVVNVLVHTTDVPISTEQLTKIKALMKKYDTQDRSDPAVMNTRDEKMENESEEKSSVISGNSEESSLQNNNEEGLTIPSSGEEHDSESDSEPSIRWSGIIPSSEESDDQRQFQRRYKSSCCLRDDVVVSTCGAEWDIFRRLDVPKLVEYLSRHSNEFNQLNGLPENVVHPIYDQCFYLDAIHKLRLKEQFNIEPWTFQQHLGEAVIVPAGCPYQIRCLKSCVNVVLDFISPENVTECINLIDERRALPPEHKARKNLAEVKKMTLNSISAAVEEIQNL